MQQLARRDIQGLNSAIAGCLLIRFCVGLGGVLGWCGEVEGEGGGKVEF